MRRINFFIVTALVLSFFIPTSSQAAGFSDVPTNHWAYDSIDELSNSNILNGYANGKYGPENKVTRAQAAKIVASALKLPLESTYKPSYQDVPSTHWAYKEIRLLTEKGIFKNSTQFNANAFLSRAQLAKVLVLAYQIKMDDHHQVTFKDVPKNYWHPYITTLAEVQITSGVSWNHFNPYGQVTRAQMAVFVDRAMTWDQKRDSGVIKYDGTAKVYVDSSLAVNDTAKETVHLVNIERAKSGLPALKLDAPLSQIATLKADDMMENNYFDHVSPTYGQPWDMANKFGYTYTSFGENIAYGHRSPQEVVKGWMDSPGHKANILTKDFTNIGAGISKDANGRIYWVHMFSSK